MRSSHCALGKKDNQDDNDTISVLDAVSFGTRDLCEETKQEFSECCANRLPPEGADAWRRPARALETIVEFVSPTPQERLLQVPSKSLLYKVRTGKRNVNGDYEYILDTLLGDDVADMEVDLLCSSNSIYKMTPEDESTDNDEEEA